MSLAVAKARALLRTYYAYMLEYRAELLLWALSNSLPFILMGAWVQAAGRADTALSPIEFARYFLAVFLVRQLTVVWVIWEFEQDLVKGRLSHFLLVPMDPVWRYLAAHGAERAARLPFTVALVALFFVLFPAAFFVPSWTQAALFVLFVVTAFALRFVLQYTIAMLCFWTERATSAETLWFISYMFLSGAIAPLEVFPPVVADVARWTPFPWLVWAPAQVLVGGDDVDVGFGLAVSAAWIGGALVLNRFLWRRGLLRNSAMGA